MTRRRPCGKRGSGPRVAPRCGQPGDTHRGGRAYGRASRHGCTGRGSVGLALESVRERNRRAAPQQACAYHHDSRHDGRDGGDATHGRGMHARRERLSGREGGGNHEQTDERHQFLGSRNPNYEGRFLKVELKAVTGRSARQPTHPPRTHASRLEARHGRVASCLDRMPTRQMHFTNSTNDIVNGAQASASPRPNSQGRSSQPLSGLLRGVTHMVR